MSKKTLYTIFIAKFLFSISLITWTIMMTLGAGVGKDNDNTFMSYYHDVDENFNQIIVNNDRFSEKYIIEIRINDFILSELSYQDIYLSQRVIKERKDRRNILSTQDNSILVTVKDKNSKKIIENIDVKILFTMPSTHEFNQEIVMKHSNETKKVVLNKKAYWNIMGSIKIGKEIGQFYIKTNAI